MKINKINYMRITRFLPIIVLVLGLSACNKPAGELVGARAGGFSGDPEPLGMKFIRQGSFLMGVTGESALFTQSDNNVRVSVNAFWMDETEITNDEYRQFVYWVRDSIARQMIFDSVVGGGDCDWVTPVYVAGKDTNRLNWSQKIPWETRFAQGGSEYDLVWKHLFYDDGFGGLNITKLRYSYSWKNIDAAVGHSTRFNVATGSYPEGAKVSVDSFWVEGDRILRQTVERPLREPKDLLTNAIICVYPDTMVWARDFQFAYNDPLLHGYFSRPSYAKYPVVGVTWEQAHAFCHWRTHLMRSIRPLSQAYRLPSEAEWEFAARGGLHATHYPWGNVMARDNKCFLANFKPYRGSYHNDTGVTTMEVAGFDPNDFGLYDMAGNVAEWTASSYSNSSNKYLHDMSPEYTYFARENDPDVLKRKVVKGGSWKDISYYLQCGVRTYEYQYESRSYIGFRCVRSAMAKQYSGN